MIYFIGYESFKTYIMTTFNVELSSELGLLIYIIFNFYYAYIWFHIASIIYKIVIIVKSKLIKIK